MREASSAMAAQYLAAVASDQRLAGLAHRTGQAVQREPEMVPQNWAALPYEFLHLKKVSFINS